MKKMMLALVAMSALAMTAQADDGPGRFDENGLSRQIVSSLPVRAERGDIRACGNVFQNFNEAAALCYPNGDVRAISGVGYLCDCSGTRQGR